MALNAFVAIGMALWIFSPNDASAAGGGYTGITTGTTGGANPGYVISWGESDGGCTSTSLSGPPNPNPIVWTVPSPSVGSGTMTASIHSGGGTQQPPSPGFGSAECAGTVVATLTWDDDGTGLPPPGAVVVSKRSNTYSTGESPDAQCGLSACDDDPQTYSYTSEQTEWFVEDEDTDEFEIEVTVSADAVASLNYQGISAFAYVEVEVETFPARLKLDGLADPVSDKRIITGQRLRATVEFESPSSQANSKYTWQVPNTAAPFADYVASTNLGDFTPYSPPPVTGSTSHTTDVYYREQAQSVEITCLVELTDLGLGFDLSDTFETKRGVFELEANPKKGAFYLIPAGNPAFLQLAYPAGINETPQRFGGYTWQGKTSDPSGFGPEVGKWCYAQLVTPSAWQRDDEGDPWYLPTANRGVEGLDYSFPYPYAQDQDGNMISMEFLCTQSYWFTDSPRIGLLPTGEQGTPQTIKEVMYDGGFKCFVLYRPPGVGSKWVPLYKFTWNCTGRALKANNTWEVKHNDSSGSGSHGYHYVHPEWTFAHL